MGCVIPSDWPGTGAGPRSPPEQHRVTNQQLRLRLRLVFRTHEDPHDCRMDALVRGDRYSVCAAPRSRRPDRRPPSGQCRSAAVDRASYRRHLTCSRPGGDLEQDAALGTTISAAPGRARRGNSSGTGFSAAEVELLVTDGAMVEADSVD